MICKIHQPWWLGNIKSSGNQPQLLPLTSDDEDSDYENSKYRKTSIGVGTTRNHNHYIRSLRLLFLRDRKNICCFLLWIGLLLFASLTNHPHDKLVKHIKAMLSEELQHYH